MFNLEDVLDLDIDSKYFKEPNAVDVNGRMIPRVTAILGRMIEEPNVAQWANSLGYKHMSYSKERDRICAIGTQVHEQINTFLKGNEINEYMMTFGFRAFREWYNQIYQLGVEVLGLEESLVSQYYCGTYDALLKIGGLTYLIDFKTSNKIHFKYFLQLAAYRKLLRDLKGIEVDRCLILQVSKYKPAFIEYLADLHYPPHQNYMAIAENTFMTLLYSYYNAMYLEGRFKYEWPSSPKLLAEK